MDKRFTFAVFVLVAFSFLLSSLMWPHTSGENETIGIEAEVSVKLNGKPVSTSSDFFIGVIAIGGIIVITTIILISFKVYKYIHK